MNKVKAIYDSFDKSYKTPFGAIPKGEKCIFTLKFPKYMNILQPTLIMFRPGYKEKFIPLERSGEEDNVYILFSCEYIPNDTGLHHYYFSAEINGNRNTIKRKDASVGAFDGSELYQLTVYEPDLKSPDWLKGGVIYQIFPDRFAIGEDVSKREPYPVDRHIHTKWDELPVWKPDAHGIVRNNDYFGGNLRGIIEKLPYLHMIGVTCIYTCPIFESHENHRYSTADYTKIDPILGTEEDFVELCETASKYGIKIILDGVFSHTGADSKYFNKFGRYGENVGAYKNSESEYRDWYSFVRYPDTYESWWGFDTLPNVNENNESYTNYICGDGGILQKWIDLGAAGWRLDVADELPDEFIDNIYKAVKAKGDDKVIYGEVWEDASNKESYGVRRRYLTGGQLDSVMNYPFRDLILNYAKYGDARQFVDGVMTICEHYPKESVDILMNFISTHDTERAITRLVGDEMGHNGREWQATHKLSDEQYVYGISLMHCAMALQFFLPGLPCIYYGDEAGMEGYKDPFNRQTFPWKTADIWLIDFVTELSRIRKSCKAFIKGEVKFIHCDHKYCHFMRIDKEEKEAVSIIVNRTRHTIIHSLETKEEIKGFEIMNSIKNEREIGKIFIGPYDYAVIKLTLI